MQLEKLNILVVDDISFYKSIVESCMDQLSVEYDIIYASGVTDALKKLTKEYNTQNKINLVISDLMMPDGKGTDLAKKLRNSKEFCNLPLVLITSETDQSELLDALNLGFDSFLNKPIEVEKLISAINQSFINRGIRIKRQS